MRKAAIIVGSSIAAIVIAAIVFYYVRDYRAKRQLVHKDSESFLMLSVDDLFIDNISELIRSTSKDTLKTDSTKLPSLGDFMHSGLAIPADLLLFSIPQHRETFYSIHKIKDREDWGQLLTKYSQGNSSPHNTEKMRFHQLHQYVQAAENGTHVLFRFGATDASWNKEEMILLEQSGDLIPLAEIDSYQKLKHKDHVTYWQSNGRLSATAKLSGKKLAIDGHWTTRTKVQTAPYMVRKMDSEDMALMLWSRLPLQDIPAIYKTIARFSGQDADGLRGDPPNYLDLLIRRQLVEQQDSIISYEYDEDFNSMETNVLQTVNVPLIESLWQGKTDLAQQLPDKFFYKLYKHQQADALMLTTKKSVEHNISYQESPYIFMLCLRMVNWPDNWLIAPFNTMQQAGVEATLRATAVGENGIKIAGEISANEPLLSLF
ncbi:hypothetical protein [Sphingobacterium deserti]|uniref:Uncharacterized protein n=1 Tax=Sphingobacterium deserti TaxID=1229276 RepID=A0A0B8SZ84_9SPHI|nr:hypothetical protein [Sphingobacterium deserti]KGE12997.1 hypothetical protein DI53_3214 [Sphingobacterium deserti]